MAGIGDKTLRKIAKDIGGSNPKVIDLGLELEIPQPEVYQYVATNKGGAQVTADGTTSMLFAWKLSTRKEDQVTVLRKALEEVGLVSIADAYLTESCASPLSSVSGQGSAGVACASSQSSISGQVYANRVTFDQQERLADIFPYGQYHKFCYKLVGYEFNQSDAILKQKLNSSSAALRQVLSNWANKGGSSDDLKRAMEASDVQGLIPKIFE